MFSDPVINGKKRGIYKCVGNGNNIAGILMKNRTMIRDMRFGEERVLYRTEHADVISCRFEGEEDGESAFKESSDLAVKDCFFDLRYPLWHVHGLNLSRSEMTENCRAALWYCRGVSVSGCRMNGIKALRECRDTVIVDTEIDSPEFGWRCENTALFRTRLVSQYAFFESKNIYAKNLNFSGKYSFQYTERVRICDSVVCAKDGFWHAKNVTLTDCTLEGEYLGWYSENLKLVRCKIKGTQPFCYCKNLTLIDCTMESCDLAFEYSGVKAKIVGAVDSVKNPRSGYIEADEIGEVIVTGDSVYPVRGRVRRRTRSSTDKE